MDKQDGNKFRYTGRTFTNDLEMADNHKISFGRSDDLQIFHQSSDSTNRLVSGAANFALPTADGTAGQSIITDGSGNLAFGTAAGTGITAVVQDTTPQLGGNLDLNGSDITGTGNLNVTGSVTADGATIDGAVDVNSSVDISGNLNMSGSGLIRTNDGTAALPGIRIGTDNDNGLYRPASNQIGFSTAGTQRMLVSSTGIDVTGNMIVDAGVNGTIDFGNVGSAYGRLYADNTGTYVGSYTNHPLILRTNNTQRMALDTSGNLLVGPSGSPVVEVDVAGEDLKVTGAVPGLELVESDNGGSRVRYAVNNSEIFQSLYGADTSTFGSITQQTRKSDGSENQVIYTYDAGTNDYHWWGTRLGGDRLVQIDSSGKFRVRGGDVSFFNDDVDAEAFFWDASESRLGLGTTSPSRNLEVEGSTAQIAIDATGSSFSRVEHQHNGTALWTTGTRSASDYHIYKESGAGNVIIDNANVGIGTDSPATDLHIKNSGSTQLLLESGTDALGYLLFGDPADSNVGSVSYDHSNNSMRFETNDSERMSISSTGAINHYGDSINAQTSASYYIRNRVSGGSLNLGVETSAGALYYPITASGTSNVTIFRNATTEIARFDTSGNLLVGKTSTAFATEGVTVNNNGSAEITKDGGAGLFLNRKTSDGDIVAFYKDGSTVGSIGSAGGDLTVNAQSLGVLQVGGSGKYGWNGSFIYPITDNASDLGTSSFRFKDIYASNGTIQTSDRNEKQDIEELSDAEQRVAVACKGLLRKFRWRSAVEEKGDDARIHFGIIAQDLQDAFTAEGLDAGRYGMFINSTWTDEETGEERSRMGVRYSELLAFIISAI